LLKDSIRSAWVPLLRLHQGAALFEANQFIQARSVFESVMNDFPNQPQALEAALHRGQCLRDESYQTIDQANQILGNPESKPAAKEAAQKQLIKADKTLHQAAEYFEKQADA